MSQVKWVLDPSHSEIYFKVKHLMITNVKGSFGTFDASIEGEDFRNAPIQLSIDVNSISTKNADRDAHLRGADFFEADAFPSITFEAAKMEAKSDTEYSVPGELTIKGVTKPVSLDISYGGAQKDPWGNDKIGFEVKTKFNRSEFGLNWNSALETGGVLVSDEVKLEADVQFVKQIQDA